MKTLKVPKGPFRVGNQFMQLFTNLLQKIFLYFDEDQDGKLSFKEYLNFHKIANCEEVTKAEFSYIVKANNENSKQAEKHDPKLSFHALLHTIEAQYKANGLTAAEQLLAAQLESLVNYVNSNPREFSPTSVTVASVTNHAANYQETASLKNHSTVVQVETKQTERCAVASIDNHCGELNSSIELKHEIVSSDETTSSSKTSITVSSNTTGRSKSRQRSLFSMLREPPRSLGTPAKAKFHSKSDVLSDSHHCTNPSNYAAPKSKEHVKADATRAGRALVDAVNENKVEKKMPTKSAEKRAKPDNVKVSSTAVQHVNSREKQINEDASLALALQLQLEQGDDFVVAHNVNNNVNRQLENTNVPSGPPPVSPLCQNSPVIVNADCAAPSGSKPITVKDSTSKISNETTHDFFLPVSSKTRIGIKAAKPKKRKVVNAEVNNSKIDQNIKGIMRKSALQTTLGPVAKHASSTSKCRKITKEKNSKGIQVKTAKIVKRKIARVRPSSSKNETICIIDEEAIDLTATKKPSTKSMAEIAAATKAAVRTAKATSAAKNTARPTLECQSANSLPSSIKNSTKDRINPFFLSASARRLRKQRINSSQADTAAAMLAENSKKTDELFKTQYSNTNATSSAFFAKRSRGIRQADVETPEDDGFIIYPDTNRWTMPTFALPEHTVQNYFSKKSYGAERIDAQLCKALSEQYNVTSHHSTSASPSKDSKDTSLPFKSFMGLPHVSKWIRENKMVNTCIDRTENSDNNKTNHSSASPNVELVSGQDLINITETKMKSTSKTRTKTKLLDSKISECDKVLTDSVSVKSSEVKLNSLNGSLSQIMLHQSFSASPSTSQLDILMKGKFMRLLLAHISASCDLDWSDLECRALVRKAISRYVNVSTEHRRCQMWCQQSHPQRFAQYVQQQASASILNSFMVWLNKWKNALARPGLRDGPRNQRKRRSARRKANAYEDDDYFPDEDDDSFQWSGEDVSELSTTYIISGPVGCGKSALVAAIANDLGFEVIEVSPSQQRSGAMLTKVLSEATQSQSVNMRVRLSSKDTASPDMRQQQSLGMKQNLVFFDEVDFQSSTDVGFYTTLHSLAQSTRCPIVLTCNRLPEELRDFPEARHLRLPSMSCKKAMIWVQAVLLSHGTILSRCTLNQLFAQRGCDIRGVLAQLQFWIGMSPYRSVANHTHQSDILTNTSTNDVDSPAPTDSFLSPSLRKILAQTIINSNEDHSNQKSAITNVKTVTDQKVSVLPSNFTHAIACVKSLVCGHQLLDFALWGSLVHNCQPSMLENVTNTEQARHIIDPWILNCEPEILTLGSEPTSVTIWGNFPFPRKLDGKNQCGGNSLHACAQAAMPTTDVIETLDAKKNVSEIKSKAWSIENIREFDVYVFVDGKLTSHLLSMTSNSLKVEIHTPPFWPQGKKTIVKSVTVDVVINGRRSRNVGFLSFVSPKPTKKLTTQQSKRKKSGVKKVDRDGEIPLNDDPIQNFSSSDDFEPDSIPPRKRRGRRKRQIDDDHDSDDSPSNNKMIDTCNMHTNTTTDKILGDEAVAKDESETMNDCHDLPTSGKLEDFAAVSSEMTPIHKSTTEVNKNDTPSTGTYSTSVPLVGVFQSHRVAEISHQTERIFPLPPAAVGTRCSHLQVTTVSDDELGVLAAALNSCSLSDCLRTKNDDGVPHVDGSDVFLDHHVRPQANAIADAMISLQASIIGYKLPSANTSESLKTENSVSKSSHMIATSNMLETICTYDQACMDACKRWDHLADTFCDVFRYKLPRFNGERPTEVSSCTRWWQYVHNLRKSFHFANTAQSDSTVPGVASHEVLDYLTLCAPMARTGGAGSRKNRRRRSARQAARSRRCVDQYLETRLVVKLTPQQTNLFVGGCGFASDKRTQAAISLNKQLADAAADAIVLKQSYGSDESDTGPE